MAFVRAGSYSELSKKGSDLVRLEGKQIVLFDGPKGVFACNNRCPHEGYPLKEGSLTDGCILTCNWHNWKFDLESGDTLVGGDTLRRYPVRIDGDEIWLDLTEPPLEEKVAAAEANLREAVDKHEYDRIARELSRLSLAGADPLEALRKVIAWQHDRFEFGTTHAIAAAPDWLAIRQRLLDQGVDGRDDAAAALVPLVESIGHFAWDALREPHFPFAGGTAPYDAGAFVAAMEAEDEDQAVRLLRGALEAGLTFADLEPAFARAALAHYADFGHSAIYVLKTGELIDALGPEVAEPLSLALTRSLIYASREDLLPEFRHYADVLGRWADAGTRGVAPTDFVGLSVEQALERALESGGAVEPLYAALLGANAHNLVSFDLPLQGRTTGSISNNVSWLDFTHGVTFSNAVRHLCGRSPELWPQGLLQMACFAGRNARYIDRHFDMSPWRVTDPVAFVCHNVGNLLDHGQFEYIVSCHQVKLTMAVADELAAGPAAETAQTLAAGLNRFLNSPLKRRHSLRTARQAMAFVAIE
ncbi:Rieske (2Fe-2S) protein [Denitrobaculum tricleocarpae]|uniref:Rieske (2Fe-2S) protein n=1 Tax=Denitrobaculum tricleocarpae TaxID=2591009 RepID=A0A545TR54_9PROT|nr:Rieske (2Fe-2S) protein [Denitrobaculum tricleocarpae]TQV79700.1 Rieske (2Fe-2S) protein [Denitrobaculum tricleocarpae]